MAEQVELQIHAESIFARLDKDGNGVIDKSEFREAFGDRFVGGVVQSLLDSKQMASWDLQREIVHAERQDQQTPGGLQNILPTDVHSQVAQVRTILPTFASSVLHYLSQAIQVYLTIELAGVTP